MSEDEIKADATGRVKKAHPNANVVNVSLVHDFFSGDVVHIDYEEGGKQRKEYVYFSSSGKVEHVTSFDQFVRSFVGKTESDDRLKLRNEIAKDRQKRVVSYGAFVILLVVVAAALFALFLAGSDAEMKKWSYTTLAGAFAFVAGVLSGKAVG